MTDLTEYFEASVRLAAALGLGGLVGLERHFHGRFAGLRTHMSVSIGSAIFAQIGTALAPLPSAEGTRVCKESPPASAFSAPARSSSWATAWK